jgi:hypothetical protein
MWILPKWPAPSTPIFIMIQWFDAKVALDFFNRGALNHFYQQANRIKLFFYFRPYEI